MDVTSDPWPVRCDEDTIRVALEYHAKFYAQGKRAWDVSYHIAMWQWAWNAFECGSRTDFDRVYEELRRRWQVFRGSRDFWSAQTAFDALTACSPALRHQRLADVTLSDTLKLWEVLQAVREVKRTQNGASTVAVSKFLHFWNPRLFVIVDDGVVWKWVFAHHWLWEPIRRTRDVTDVALFGNVRTHPTEFCDLGTYLAVLIWAGEFIRVHPQLPILFRDYVRRHADDAGVDIPFAEYHAAAIEWFLLGVVEIPPSGWTGRGRE